MKNTDNIRRTFQIEITRNADRLKLSANEQIPGQGNTIQHYQDLIVSMDAVETRSLEMTDLLSKSKRSEQVGRDVLTQIRQIGQYLYDELFSLDVKEKLKNTLAEDLILKIDDRLVHIPWELLHDGKKFLCLRFNMGRRVVTRQRVSSQGVRHLVKPFKMLIIADPSGDLKGAYEEGIKIRNEMDKKGDLVNAFLDSGNITADVIKSKIRNFDMVHFAGHADYNTKDAGDSGWQLAGGTLKAKDITKMIGTAGMPSLIFANACQSARTGEWRQEAYYPNQVFGLANAFLLAGVRHYIGTFWEISDTTSSYFALHLYRHMFSGCSVGEAVRKARADLILEHSQGVIAWASYVLYGDPSFNYQDQLNSLQEKEEPASDPIAEPGQQVRTRDEVIDFSKAPETGSVKKIWTALTAAIILLIFLGLWVWPGYLNTPVETYEQNALTFYQKGEFKEALKACEILEKKAPDSSLSDLIRGHIFLSSGSLNQAQEAYQDALDQKQGSNRHKSQALLGLGRIASIRGKSDEALGFYEKAAKFDPDNRAPLFSQALILENRGDFQTAAALLERARAGRPEDYILNLISRETQKKLLLAEDLKKQEYIDRTIKELLENMKSRPKENRRDEWTSSPLSLWLMDFESEGYALEEGKARLIHACMTDQMLAHNRIRLVERTLLNNLVQELKLGTSRLVDRETSLYLGRILAARLIVSGRMVYSGPQVQMSMRVIETETGRILASVSRILGSTIPADLLAKEMAGGLFSKIAKRFPLRGKVIEVNGGNITLNIGKSVGVKQDQIFRTLDGASSLEVVSILENQSVAKKVKGADDLKQGMLLQALSSSFTSNRLNLD